MFPVFVISFSLAFLSFTQFLLLTLPVVPCFFSSCIFILVFTPIILYKRILAFCGQNNVNWIKRVFGPICPDLLKPFYWRIVFCGRSIFCYKFVFCCRFAFYCRSLSLALLSLGLSYSLVFLVGLWALLFIGLFSVWAFGYRFAKMGNNKSKNQIQLYSKLDFIWSSNPITF